MHKKALAEVGVLNGLHNPKTAAVESTFLTKAQQDTLDAAVLEKQKKAHLQREKSHSEEASSLRTASTGLPHHYKDRASRTKSDKLQGKPKKRGAGGKYNWGGALDCEGISGAQDPNDPNYDSGTETSDAVWLKEAQLSADSAKPLVASIVKEYLLTGNQVEAIASLQNLSQAVGGSYLIRKVISTSLDYSGKERELASQLISAMYSTIVTPSEMEQGFQSLIEDTCELQLDVPDAVHMLALFLARAVVDDILPPAFLTKLKGEETAQQQQPLEKAKHLLKAPHSAQRLLSCWGSPDSSSYASLVQKVQELIDEYLSSDDVKEAQACVDAINAPPAMHELVKQALLKAMAHDRESQIFKLLSHLDSTGQISQDQFEKGFKRVGSNLEDFSLDIPNASAKFAHISQKAVQAGWISESSLGRAVSAGSLNGNKPGAKAWGAGLKAFKKAVLEIMQEYFVCGDALEVKEQLLELDQPGLNSLAVKQAVQLALSAKDRERELTARLLVALHKEVIPSEQLGLGFKRLLASAEDLVLDVPTAPHHLSIFLARIIVDELQPPAFLTSALDSLANGSMGVEIIKATGSLLRQRHAYERVQSYWNSSSNLNDARSQIDALVAELLQTGDAAEASRRWMELGLPFFGHHLVFTILRADFGSPDKHAILFKFLKRLVDCSEVSQTQLEMGFDRVEQQIGDLQLDFPIAPKQFAVCKKEAQQHSWLVEISALPNGVHPQ